MSEFNLNEPAPRPWTVEEFADGGLIRDAAGRPICSVHDHGEPNLSRWAKANAELIVRAVNAYSEPRERA